MKMSNAITGLSALAHEGRLDVFRRLVQAGPEGLAAGALARAAGVNLPTASAQLAVLTNAGLITKRRAGRSIIYHADYDAMRALISFLMEDCCRGRAEILTPLAQVAADAACCAPSPQQGAAP